MTRVPSVVCVVLLLGTVVAGCLADDPVPAPVVEEGPLPVPSYAPIVTQNLTTATFGILPRIIDRVQASADGIDLHVEIHLPDGEGPFPTILHSSPYNALERVPGAYPERFPYKSMVERFVPRGYAVVVADVRGFGESGGCVEVWGKNEQQDQYDLVQWIAARPWSDGKVAMEGASYPGTTPVEAAVMAPPALTTVVVVAGLTDPYYDWHFGGVPNGESGPAGSPAAYHGIGAVAPVEPMAGADWLAAAGATYCDTAPFVLDAFSPDGTYTSFYDERNLSARAKQVQVPVLFTQGFDDSNVKPSQILNWFNELDVPKKAYLGQWAHEYPDRDDWADILHAWFDHHLKGIQNGVMDGPAVEVVTNLDTWRGAHLFPDDALPRRPLYLGAGGAMTDERMGASEERFTSERIGDTSRLESSGLRKTQLTFTTDPLEEDLYLSGVPFLRFVATLEGGTNTYFRARLYGLDNEGVQREVTFGGLNAALRNGVRAYEAVPEGEPTSFTLPFQPAEYIFRSGDRLRLVVDTWDVFDATTPDALANVEVTLHLGEGSLSHLDLPVIPGRPDLPAPWPGA